MRLVLEVTSFQKALMGGGSRHEFDERGGLIGRGRRSDWVLPDPDRYVSGTHAEISHDGERFYIIDVSTNGLFLNDASVPLGRGGRWPVSDGDRMALGDFEIVARIEEDAADARVADTPLPVSRPTAPPPPTSAQVSAVDIDSLLDAEPAPPPPPPKPLPAELPPEFAAAPEPRPTAPAPPTPPPPTPDPVSGPPPSAVVPPPPPRLTPRPSTGHDGAPALPPVFDAEIEPATGPREHPAVGEPDTAASPSPVPEADDAPSAPREPEREAANGPASEPAAVADHAAAIAEMDLDDLIGPLAGTAEIASASERPASEKSAIPPPIPPPPPVLPKAGPALPPVPGSVVAPAPETPSAPPVPDDIDDLLGEPFDAPPDVGAVEATAEAATEPPSATTASGRLAPGRLALGRLAPDQIAAGADLPEGLDETERKARLWDEFTRVYNNLREDDLNPNTTTGRREQ